jgi:hypothetical protein
MKKTKIMPAGLLVLFALAFAVYIWRAAPQTARSLPSPERRPEVADLRKQIGVLEERVNTLEERLAAQRVSKLHHKEQ